MEIGELESKILGVIKEKASAVGKENVTLDLLFSEKPLSFDSLDSVELLMELEDAGVVDHKIPDEVAHTFKNGRNVVEYSTGPAEYIAKYNILVKDKNSPS